MFEQNMYIIENRLVQYKTLQMHTSLDVQMICKILHVNMHTYLFFTDVLCSFNFKSIQYKMYEIKNYFFSINLLKVGIYVVNECKKYLFSILKSFILKSGSFWLILFYYLSTLQPFPFLLSIYTFENMLK